MMLTSSLAVPVTPGRLDRETGFCRPFGATLDFETLNEFIGQQVAGDADDLFLLELARDAVLHGSIDGQTGSVFDAEDQSRGIPSRASFVVGNAGR